MMRTLDLSPLFRSSVGFDRLDKMFDEAFRESSRESGYPPYNIVKTGAESYRVTMAVAGFGEDDLEILSQENLLTIRGRLKETDKDVEYLHRGIANRAFEHKFQLADHVHVTGARLLNGMLDVELAREVPEAMKPRRIAVNAQGGPKVIEGEAA